MDIQGGVLMFSLYRYCKFSKESEPTLIWQQGLPAYIVFNIHSLARLQLPLSTFVSTKVGLRDVKSPSQDYRSTPHVLCWHGQLVFPICTSASSSIKWVWQRLAKLFGHRTYSSNEILRRSPTCNRKIKIRVLWYKYKSALKWRGEHRAISLQPFLHHQNAQGSSGPG